MKRSYGYIPVSYTHLAFGGFNFIEFHGRNNVVVNPLRIKKDIIHELQYNLLLCYTGNIHVSANIIKDQVKNYEKKDAFDAMCAVSYTHLDVYKRQR